MHMDIHFYITLYSDFSFYAKLQSLLRTDLDTATTWVTVGSRLLSIENGRNCRAWALFNTDVALCTLVLVQTDFKERDMFCNPCHETQRTDQIAKGPEDKEGCHQNNREY